MAQVNAGRVRFVGRGEYNNSTQYYVFDLVNYNGNSYYAKVDTIGHLPTDTTYWQLVAEKGNVGPTGLTGNGISTITKTSTSGLVDTYTITYTNGNTTTFNVSNGNGIDRIEKTATVGNKDTYTIYFTNGSTTTYEVANGEVTREELEEEVERLSMIYNAFPSTTGETEEGSINGTAEVPFKEIGLKGNTSQVTTTGKNFFNINASHTDVSSTTYKYEYTLKPNTQYTISSNVPNSNTANVYANGTSSSTNKVCLNNSQTITSDANGYFYVLVRYVPASGDSSTINMYQAILDGTYYLQIEEGSTATNYEPYTNGASPNPDYPQDVEVVTGDNTINICGKNLAYTGWATNFVNAVNNQYVYMTTKDNRTCLRYTPGAGYGSYDTKNLTLGIKFKENTRYTISCDILKEENTSNTIAFYYTDGTYTAGGGTSAVNTWEHKTITSSANKTIMYIAPYYTSGNTNIDINTWQIEEGSTATSYEPYKSQSYSVNIGTMELCKIGTYQDYIRKSTGKNLINSLEYHRSCNSNNGNIATPVSSPEMYLGIEDYVNVKPNTTYTVSFQHDDLTASLYIGTKDINGNFIERINLGVTRTFTTGSNVYKIFLFIYKSGGNYTINGWTQLVEGSTALPYEPYGKVWYKYGAIGKVVLDGTNNAFASKSGQLGNSYSYNATNFIAGPGLNVVPSVLSNKFVPKSWNNRNNYLDNAIMFIYSLDTSLIFRFGTSSSLTTLTLANSWLINNNVTLYGILATPTITPITDTTLIEQLDNLEKAYSYDTQTNISQTNQDKPFIISYEAILSLKNVLNS